MKKQNRLHLLMLLFLFINSSLLQAQKKHHLSLKLTPNTSYNVEQRMTQQVEQDFQGRHQTTQQVTTTTYQYQVKEKDSDGFYTIIVLYQKVYYKNGRNEYNSEDSLASETPLSQALGAIVGKQLQMKVNDQGQVKELTGGDAIIEEMLNARTISNDQIRQRLKKTFKKAFGSKALKEAMEQFFNIYPDKPVATGDTWSKTINKTAAFPSKANITWQLDEIDNQTALVSVKAQVRPKENTKIDLGVAMARYNLKGTQEGSTDIDIKTGWATRTYIKQVMSGKMYITMSGSSQEIEVDAKITTISEYKTLKE